MIVAPCVDRCFLVDGLSPPVPISDSISSIYMAHVRAGHRPGGAKVFRNHYFLPILNATADPGRPARVPPQPAGQGAAALLPVVAVGRLPGRHQPPSTSTCEPRRIFRAVHQDGWQLDLHRRLPAVRERRARSLDADGEPLVFDVETRDFPTGNGQPNHVRRLRLFYFASARVRSRRPTRSAPSSSATRTSPPSGARTPSVRPTTPTTPPCCAASRSTPTASSGARRALLDAASTRPLSTPPGVTRAVELRRAPSASATSARASDPRTGSS